MNWVLFLIIIGTGGIMFPMASDVSQMWDNDSQIPTVVIFALSVLCLALAAGMGTK